MHTKKVAAGIAVLCLPILLLSVALHSIYVQCFIIAANRLPSVDNLHPDGTHEDGVYPVCDRSWNVLTTFLMVSATGMIAGLWLIVFGLTNRSLISGTKDAKQST